MRPPGHGDQAGRGWETLRRGRTHRLLLAVMVALGLARGMWWVITYPAPWGDEDAHLGYVQRLATGHGIPVVGRDHVSLGVVELRKDNTVDGFRDRPFPASLTNPAWGEFTQQYEGVQGPVYYALVVPAYWLGQPWGLAGSLYAIRVASLLLVLTAIPLTHRLARRLAVDRPGVWLLAPLLLLALQITTSQYTLVDNDAVLLPLGALVLLATVHAWERPGWAAGLGVGAMAGLALVAKASAVLVLPAILLGFLISRDRPLPAVVRAAFGASGAAAIVLLPWIVFNEIHYHALSAAAVNSRITDTLPAPRTLAGLGQVVTHLFDTLWATESVTASRTTLAGTAGYRLAVDGLVLVSLGLGLAHAALGANRTAPAPGRAQARLLGWVIVSLVGAVAVAGLAALAEAGSGVVVEGRNSGFLLPLVCVGVAVGLTECLGSRWGTWVLVAAVAGAGVLEIPSERAVVHHWYTTSVIGGSVPVVDDSFATATVTERSMSVAVPCQAHLVGLLALGQPPTVTIDGRAAAPAGTVEGWTLYRSGRAVSGLVELTFGRPTRLVAGPRLPGAGPAPVVRAWCPVPHPDAYRFAQLWGPSKSSGVGLAVLLDWPDVDAVILAGLALVVGRRAALDRSC